MGLWGNAVATVTAADTSIALTGTATDPIIGVGVSAARLTPVVPLTSGGTAAAGTFIPIDTTAGNVALTFPTAPADKTQFAAKHTVRGGTNLVTFVLGGSDVFNVAGGPTSGTLFTLLNQGAIFQYKASGAIWFAIAADLPLSQLDLRYAASSAAAPALLLTTGEETIPRVIASSALAPTGNTTLRLTYFRARKTETTTQVRMLSAVAAAATPTLCRIGLFSIDGSGNGTLVAATVNDTALFSAGNTAYTRSWASSFSKVAGQLYALGVVVATSVAAPTLVGAAVASAVTAEWGIDPRLTGTIAGQTDLPSSFAAGSVTTSTTTQPIYAAILP